MPPRPTALDLNLLSTDDLCAELIRRNDFIVIGLLKLTTPSQYIVTRKFSGSRHVCLGLLSNLMSIINDDENKSLGKMI